MTLLRCSSLSEAIKTARLHSIGWELHKCQRCGGKILQRTEERREPFCGPCEKKLLDPAEN